LARALEPQLGEFNAKKLADTAWAFARLARSNKKLFELLAKPVVHLVGKLNAQELATVVCAFTSVDQSDQKLFATVARAVERRVCDSGGRAGEQILHAHVQGMSSFEITCTC